MFRELLIAREPAAFCLFAFSTFHEEFVLSGIMSLFLHIPVRFSLPDLKPFAPVSVCRDAPALQSAAHLTLDGSCEKGAASELLTLSFILSVSRVALCLLSPTSQLFIDFQTLLISMVAATEMDGDSRVDIKHDSHLDDTEDDEEDKEPPMVKLDFDKLFKMAEDPDLEELLRSPLDQAIINLDTGSEIQKLTAIRTFPDILDTSDGDKCLLKMLPAIQKCLKVEKSNLDLHCEAAVVYKSIIQNEKLVKKFQGIVDLLLENILQNIQNQKEHHTHEKEKVVIKAGSSINNQMHHLSAAAWLETIVEVADKLSLSSIKQFIIPVIQTQAEPVQRVQRRIIATKIIHKLAMFLPPNEIRKDLCPIVATLCKDANSNVRVAIAQRLFVVANALKNSHDVVSCLLTSYVQLLGDEEMNVREAAMTSLTDSFSLFTRDARKHTLFSTIKKLTEEALEKKNEGLPVISHNFGKWSWELNELLDQLDKSWVLNTFCKMVQISDEICEGPQKNIRNVLKKTCCFNYPCMLTMFKKQADRLLPFLEVFCTDHDEDVRVSIAASFHEILNMFPSKTELIPPFIELLHGGSSDVIAKVSHSLTKILPLLYENVKENPGKTTILQLDRLLIGCNQILRNSSSWRSHEALLKSLKTLPMCVEESTIIETFVPLLKKEILNVRAIPCRVAACETLLVLMRHISNADTRKEIIEFLNEELSNNVCCYRRITYIDVAEIVLTVFSKRIFVEHFLDDTLRLTSDPVSNIRIRAIKFLPKIKAKLRLPDDNEVLLKIENYVKEQLKTTEQNAMTRAIINQAAVELSRCETCSDSLDDQKVKEEEEMWAEKKTQKEKESRIKKPSIRSRAKMRGNDEEEEEEGEFTRGSGLRVPTSSVRATSPWRTERKAIAVVRPQPVLTVRSQSPSPMSYRSPSPAPKETAIRPSRLPLSSAAKEREKLRRAATDTPPPPARSARSASVVASRRSDAMTSSTSSIEPSNSSSAISSTLPSSGYGLRRSATSSSTFGGSSFTSTSSYSLMHARSSSNLRRPGYGLSHVSSLSTHLEPSTLTLQDPSLPIRLFQSMLDNPNPQTTGSPSGTANRIAGASNDKTIGKPESFHPLFALCHLIAKSRNPRIPLPSQEGSWRAEPSLLHRFRSGTQGLEMQPLPLVPLTTSPTPSTRRRTSPRHNDHCIDWKDH